MQIVNFSADMVFPLNINPKLAYLHLPRFPSKAIRAKGMTQVAKENVWNYPRPPAIEPASYRLRVYLDGVLLADTSRSHRILETSHPPTYYIPPEDVKMEYFKENRQQTYCEWKGNCSYYDVTVNGKAVKNRVWFYKNAEGTGGKYAAIKGALSFYADPFECFVGDEKVKPQPGDFYGGWMTSWIEGQVKGGPGTWGW
ncbi:hypothetical protein BJ742DRAFT_821322, partial [Cladochytrium replicatum]